ncbi:hypothetical protein [uncultured Pontibacter sp.]|uniref:O-antigen ligase family protein n=1 Tax=uncultured Pontibacter sp. TaxID=453356 RepID=UPI002627CC67|nr:hypothetical protein [uncultured Pontibacter sp.]
MQTVKYFKSLNNFEKFLLVALIVSPYTLLRIGFLGLAELIIIALFIKEFTDVGKGGILAFGPFSRFWLSYLIISLFGFAYNLIFLDYATGTLASLVFDFSAYVMLLMSCLLIEGSIKRKKINTYLFIKYFFLISSGIMLALYILSFFTSSLLGLSLKYYIYFVPLAKNLHQISMFLVPLPFLGLRILLVEKNVKAKLLICSLIVADVVMASSTGSEKAIISLIVGSIVFVIFKFLYTLNLRSRRIFIFLLSFISGTILMLNIEFAINWFVEYFEEIDMGGGRAMLYGKAIEVGLNSPLVGLGTGGHIYADGKFWDAHQTFITAFLQTGLVGVLILIILLFNVAKKAIYNPAIIAAFSAIFMYALGGDVLRRLPIWIMLVIIFYYEVGDERRLIKTKKGILSV